MCMWPIIWYNNLLFSFWNLFFVHYKINWFPTMLCLTSVFRIIFIHTDILCMQKCIQYAYKYTTYLGVVEHKYVHIWGEAGFKISFKWIKMHCMLCVGPLYLCWIKKINKRLFLWFYLWTANLVLNLYTEKNFVLNKIKICKFIKLHRYIHVVLLIQLQYTFLFKIFGIWLIWYWIRILMFQRF